jgi:hypothetical protein
MPAPQPCSVLIPCFEVTNSETAGYHAVSKKHLHRYVGEFDFRWNTRKMNDGERTVLAVQGANGKRLDYKTFTQE